MRRHEPIPISSYAARPSSTAAALPPYTADVAVRDERDHRRSAGSTSGRATELDADGAVLAPGFVDIHTHYDAQLHWEPTASPSSWHGVTTVITGNCGFSLFPARPADVPWMLKMLSRVEGMPPETLAVGVDVRAAAGTPTSPPASKTAGSA